MKLKCFVCEADIEVLDSAKKGDRVTCPNCFSQTAIFINKGKKILACAFCKDPVFDPNNCDKCERKEELYKIYDEGKL